MSSSFDFNALRPGTRLLWFVIERVCGHGGFGITYRAEDTNVARAVALKEYFPAELVERTAEGSLRPTSGDNADAFRWGLERFLQEARTLARFDHPNIVRVHTVFEHGGTAYMVMRFEEGRSLAEILDERGPLAEEDLTRMIEPILEGLELVHTGGFIHRDIKPANIHVRPDGSGVLLDFGAARQALGRRSRALTRIVSPGFAPLEQYAEGSDQQGPWTDIYGLGATLYQAVTGELPVDAIERSKGVLGSTRDLLPPAAELARGRYRERFLRAIDHALSLKEADRPQSVSAWRRELREGEPAETIRLKAPARRKRVPRAAAVFLGVAVVSAAAVWFGFGEPRFSLRGPSVDPPGPAMALTGTARTGAAQDLLAEREIAERQAALQRAESGLEARARELETQAATLATRDRTLLLRAAELAGQAQAAAQSAAGLAAREAAAETREERLASADRDLADRTRQLEARETELAARAQRSQRREIALREAQAALEDRAARSPAVPTPARSDRAEAAGGALAGGSALGAGPELTLDQAVRAFDEGAHARSLPALRRFPESAEARLRLALAAIHGYGMTAAVPAGLTALRELLGPAVPRAYYELGRLHETGLLVALDPAQARELYQAGAQLGEPKAQFALGGTYEHGRGVPPSAYVAYIWYATAAGCGHADAAPSVARMSRRLKPAELPIAEKAIANNRRRFCPG